MTGVVVHELRGNCRICRLPGDLREEINAAIWPNGGMKSRSRTFAASAWRVGLEHAVVFDKRTVARHADHVEKSWRTITPATPPSGSEVEVFDVGLDAVTDRAAQLGARAMGRIVQRIPVMEDKDLVAVAKMGVSAVERREALRIKDRRPNINLLAVFGLVSGHVPDSEREIEEHPVALLEAELDAERQAYAVRDLD